MVNEKFQPQTDQGRNTPSLFQKIISDSKIQGDVTLENLTQIGSQTVISKEISFFEPELKPFSRPTFPTPRVAKELINTLYKHHFLVLSDGIDVDKSSLARHLASLLSEGLQKLKGFQAVKVKEWYRTLHSGDIEFELDDHSTPKILILSQAEPQNLLSDTFLDLQKKVYRTNHFIIATTDTPFKAWNLLNSCLVWWRDLSKHDVADCERLINKLSHEETLNGWYHNALDEREQLLAIGLSLFDGLYDDQFFAVLEEVVNKVWQRRNANLKALDYCDLNNLGNYFDFIDTDDQHSIVKIRFSKQCLTCLKIAWSSHRRQILLALPTLVKLVLDTGQLPDGELYGNPIRRAKLRQSVSESISAIGLISRLGSREAVNISLLTLAASQDIEIQAVAAQSIASWRDQENKGFILDGRKDLDADIELFKLLESWQASKEISHFIELLFENRTKDESNQAKNYIRATLAITIAFASTYDPIDNLSDKLFNLFKDLSKDKDKLVRDRFKRYAIPFFVGRHLSSIREFLRVMIRDSELIPSTAESLAQAYKSNTLMVTSLLQEWEHDCLNKYKKVAKKGKLDQRESLLITVALAYSQIFQYNSPTSVEGISIFDAYSGLVEILSLEKHQLTRQVLIMSIGKMLSNNFVALADKIDETFQYLKYGKETDIFENILSDIYHHQRANLSSGDDTFDIDKKIYPIWLDQSQRLVTPVETYFFSWIKNDKNKRLQQISARCLMSFVRSFEEKEEKAIDEARARIDKERAETSVHIQDEREETSTKAIFPVPPKEKFFLEKFIPWLATQEASSYRPSVSHLLPETVKHASLISSSSDFLFQKLNTTKDAKLIGLSKFLRRGIWLSKHFFAISFILGVAIIIVSLYFRYVHSQSEEPNSLGIPRSTAPNKQIENRTPEEIGNTVDNPFDNETFPKEVCGDRLPSDLSSYPIRYYPVFIDYSDENFSTITRYFCNDAIRKFREDMNENSIQVASFASWEKAEFFRDFLADKQFSGADIGNSTLVERPHDSFSPLSVLQKGAIQFPEGETSLFLEERFEVPSVHQFTFMASAGQSALLYIDSQATKTYLDIAAPSGQSIVKVQSELTSWSGILPEGGAYQVSVVAFQAPNSYRLFLEIGP